MERRLSVSRKYFVLVLLVFILALTVTALVACNERKSGVNFIVDGKVYASLDDFDVNSSGVPIDPQKEGYVFRGWYLDNGTWRQPYDPEPYINNTATLSEIINVYAYFITEEDFLQLNEYKISYVNVKGENPNPVKYAYGLDHDIILQPLSAEGYEFLGWSTTDNEYVSGIKPGATGDKTYVANWRLIEYDMLFVDENGETVESIKYTVETDPADIESRLPAVPVKTGYDSEWEKIDCSAPLGDSMSKEVKVINTPIKYNITYNIEGEYDIDVPKSNNLATYTIESEFELKAASKAGYKFLHWLDKNGEIVDTIEPGNTGDLEFTAEWEAIDYSIKFYVKDNINSDYRALNYDYKYNVETDIAEVDEFPINSILGYDSRFDYNKTVFYPPEDGKTSKDIYAKYTPIKYTLSYTHPDGEENFFICNFTIEDTISLENEKPYRNGYKFKGFVDPATNQGITEISNTTGNVVLDTDWERITYTVTFTSTLFSESSESSKTYLPTPITYTVEDEKIDFKRYNACTDGYTFLGWKENGKPIGSTDDNLRNITLVASWRQNVYSIKYFGVNEDLNNDNPTSYICTFTEQLCTPGVEPGYTFEGWFKADDKGNILDDDTKISEITAGKYYENLNLRAKFSETEYYITFVHNFVSADGIVETKAIDVVDSENNPVYTTEVPLTFTISSKTIDVSSYSPQLKLENYEFVGWYYLDEDANPVMVDTINPAKDYGNKRLFADWKQVAGESLNEIR